MKEALVFFFVIMVMCEPWVDRTENKPVKLDLVPLIWCPSNVTCLPGDTRPFTTTKLTFMYFMWVNAVLASYIHRELRIVMSWCQLHLVASWWCQLCRHWQFMTTCGAASDDKVGIMTTYSVYEIHTMWRLHQQILNHIHIMISISCNMLFIASLKSIPHHYDLCIATSLTARCNINLLIFLYGCLPSGMPPNGTSQFAIHIINCSCYGGWGLWSFSYILSLRQKNEIMFVCFLKKKFRACLVNHCNDIYTQYGFISDHVITWPNYTVKNYDL